MGLFREPTHFKAPGRAVHVFPDTESLSFDQLHFRPVAADLAGLLGLSPMISALYNLSLPVFNEEWHPWDKYRWSEARRTDSGRNCWSGAWCSRFVDLQSPDQRLFRLERLFRSMGPRHPSEFPFVEGYHPPLGLGGNAFDLRRISPGVSSVGIVGCRAAHGVKDAVASSLEW